MGPEVHRQRRRLSSASSNEAAIPLLVIPAVRVREGLYHLFDMLAFDRFEIASTAGSFSRVDRYCCTSSHCSGVGNGGSSPRKRASLHASLYACQYAKPAGSEDNDPWNCLITHIRASSSR